MVVVSCQVNALVLYVLWWWNPNGFGLIGLGPSINLCFVLGIAHNGNSQKEFGWWMVVWNGYAVTIYCELDYPRRSLGNGGAL